MESPLLLFDFADANGQPRRLRFADPVRVLTASRLAEVAPTLEAVQSAVNNGRYYAAGYVAYEAAPAFDSALTVRSPDPEFPLVWFGIYKEPLYEPAPSPPASIVAYSLSEWQSDTTRALYEDAFSQIRQAIADGETYQVNYTLRLQAEFAGDPLSFYERLHAAQRSRYSALLDLGRCCILSASPELFFHRLGNRVTTRPMKGTRRRGRWNAEDAQIAQTLQRSEKDRAENLMVVDMLRNDLGRVAQVGSVSVPELFALERYPTVWQMTSTVTADVSPETTLADLFAALFPCGSVTGAPKVTAMRRIAQLETAPRHIYCGAIGWLSPQNETVFSVAIRTALLNRETETITYGAGSGITWDSRAEEEYAEALVKAAIVTEGLPAFDLLETLRLENGNYTLRERHIQRLVESADYWDFPCDSMAAVRLLEDIAQSKPTGMWRVRLLVAPDGKMRAECHALEPLPDMPLSVALAQTPVATGNRFLYHKTTHRAFYQELRAPFPDAFDVLLWNEREEITEFTTGNVVVEAAGQYWTPFRECGLLAGTLRSEMLATGRIEERVIRLSDLAHAEQLWFLNSVRGWVPVRLLTPSSQKSERLPEQSSTDAVSNQKAIPRG